MLTSSPTLAALLLGLVPQGDVVAPRVERILATAERYVSSSWEGEERHRFHGRDPAGVPVDTPDAGLRAGGWRVGETNRGVPYKWGGWSTPEEFLAGIEGGSWAGHWPADPSDPRTTSRAVGVDCSGFVSRCWGLAYKHSTRSLGPLCLTIEWDALRPGDLLTSFDGHAILFESWADEERTRIVGVESTWPGVVRKERRVDALKRGGLVPQRYAPLDPSWPELAPAAAVAFAVGEFVAREEFSAEDLRIDLRGEAGAWARYAWSGQLGELEVTRTLAGAAPAGPERSTVVCAVTSAEGSHEHLEHLAQEAGVLALRHVFPAGQPLDSIELRSVVARRGRYASPAGELDAQRIELVYGGTFTVRGRVYPYHVELRLVRSDALPLEGVIEARMKRTIELDEPFTSTGHLQLASLGS